MRIIGLGAFCVSLLTPAAALANDVTVALPGATIPVGPAGTTVVNVSRSIVAGERFAVIRARAPEQLSRCGVAPERVAVWGLLEGAWTEMAHEVIDRCPTAPTRAGRRVQPQVVRARIVEIIERGLHRAEFHVRLVDSRLPSDQWPVTRYHRDGDRFTVQRPTEVLAASPGLAPRRTLAELTGAQADGRLVEWGATEALARSERGTLWVAQQGDDLLVAADVTASGEARPTVTLHLADVRAGTALVRGSEGNSGRVVRFTCGDAAGSAGARCERVGDRWHVEGSVALGAQVFRGRSVEALQVLAFAGTEGRTAVSSSAALRLEPVQLARSIDLLRGASPEVVARCGDGYLGRVSPPGAMGSGGGLLDGALVTCGTRCRDGYCERMFGVGDVAGRLEWAHQGTCLRGLGPGGASVDGCHAGASSRLLGTLPVQGFDVLVGVERSWSTEDTRWRQGELWALVTATAQWERLRVGVAQRAARPIYSQMEMRDGHPSLCGSSEGSCEVFGDLTLHGREQAADSVTAEVVETLRRVGLGAGREPQRLSAR